MILFIEKITNVPQYSYLSKAIGEEVVINNQKNNKVLVIQQKNFEGGITPYEFVQDVMKFTSESEVNYVVTDFPLDNGSSSKTLISYLNKLDWEYETIDSFQDVWPAPTKIKTPNNFFVTCSINNWKDIKDRMEGVTTEIPVINFEVKREYLKDENLTLDKINEFTESGTFDAVLFFDGVIAFVDDEGLLKSGNYVMQYDLPGGRESSKFLAGKVLLTRDVNGITYPFIEALDYEYLKKISSIVVKLAGVTN